MAILLAVVGIASATAGGSTSGPHGAVLVPVGSTVWVAWGAEPPQVRTDDPGFPLGSAGAGVAGCLTDRAGWTNDPVSSNVDDGEGCGYAEHAGSVARTALLCASMGGCSVALSHVDGFDFAGIICGSIGASGDGLSGVPGPLSCYAYQHGAPPSAWDAWASRVAAQPHPLDAGARLALAVHVVAQQ